MLDATDLQPVSDFLGRYAPYSKLTAAERDELARELSVEYARRGSSIPAGASEPRVYVVRSGAVRELDQDGNLRAEHGEGDTFGVDEERKAGAPHAARWEALEDTLLYSLTRARFSVLSERSPLLHAFFAGQRTGLAQGQAAALSRLESSGHGDALTTRISSLLEGSVVRVASDASIRTAAQRMTEARVSSLVICGPENQLYGIVTDRDLRSRVVAEGRSVDDQIHTIMSAPVVTVRPDASLMQALVTMAERGLHHLVVVDDEHPVGVVTLSDWMRAQTLNPIYLLDRIRRQTDVTGLSLVSAERPRVVVQLMESGLGAREVHALLTLIGDAVTRRLIGLVSDELRAEGLELPREGWCWVAFGSQARREHSLGSDQDNGLVLADHLDPSEPRFRALAERVCAGLDACGYAYCRGGIMASQDGCRKTLGDWASDFSHWIRNPTGEAVLRSAIFFDLRALHGQEELLDSLRARVAAEAAARPLFMAHLARDALDRRPPLGFFRQLVVEPSGERTETLDVKQRGVGPIVDLARVYALESRCPAQETFRRLRWARDREHLGETDFVELEEALRVIQRERLWHHVRCVKGGRPVDDRLRPEELSGVERRQLRDAFLVVQGAQQALELGRQLRSLGR